MKKFELIRSYLSTQTMGMLIGHGLKLSTLERPWRDNQVDVSCIKEGAYLVKRDKTGKHQWFAIQDVEGRTGIEIHIGNRVNESLGCLMLGIRFSPSSNLLHSRDAIETLLGLVGDEDFIINIRAATANDWL